MEYTGITNFTNYRARALETFITANDVFTSEEVDKICEIMSRKELFMGQVAIEQDEEILKNSRKSNIAWISPDEESIWIFKRLNKVIEDVNNNHFNFVLNGYDSLQYTEYNAKYEGKYDYHLDSFLGANPPPTMIEFRKLSFTFLLSEPEVDYQGGRMEILVSHTGPAVPIMKRGSIMFFPSFLLHRVAEVTEGKRKSLVGWVTGPKFR
jgi:PKHD-type hydroxylase